MNCDSRNYKKVLGLREKTQYFLIIFLIQNQWEKESTLSVDLALDTPTAAMLAILTP